MSARLAELLGHHLIEPCMDQLVLPSSVAACSILGP